MSAQDNAALARRVYEAFNFRDYAAALALAGDDVELLIVPFNRRYHGKEGLEAFMRGVVAGFDDMGMHLTNQVADAHHVVNEFIARGTHTGALLLPEGPIAATGRVVEYPAIDVWRVRRGKLTGLYSYFDAATLRRQLEMQWKT